MKGFCTSRFARRQRWGGRLRRPRERLPALVGHQCPASFSVSGSSSCSDWPSSPRIYPTEGGHKYLGLTRQETSAAKCEGCGLASGVRLYPCGCECWCKCECDQNSEEDELKLQRSLFDLNRSREDKGRPLSSSQSRPHQVQGSMRK